MKKIVQFISLSAFFVPLMAAQAHSGHGISQNGGSIFHYTVEHQGFMLFIGGAAIALFKGRTFLSRSR